MSDQKPILAVGADDGFKETKIVIASPGFNAVFKLPSQAKAGQVNRVNLQGRDMGLYAYRCNDTEYVAGAIEQADPTAFDDYPISALNRVIVMHALRMALAQAGLPANSQLHICSGLPVRLYYRGKSPNDELIKAKRKNLKDNGVTASDGGALPSIVRHSVTAEAVAAWLDHVIHRDREGRLQVNEKFVQQRIAIVDIGGRTTDVAVIRDWDIDLDRSGSADLGMIQVYESVEHALQDKFQTELSIEQIDSAVNSSRIRVYGKEHDVAALVTDAKRAAVEGIMSMVKRKLARNSDIDQVILVGGTVCALEPYLGSWFPNQVVAPEPAFANARGMAKFAEMNNKG